MTGSAILAALGKAWAWLKAHWYVPLFALGVVLGWAVSRNTRRKGPPREQVAAELDAMTAGAEADKMAAALGKAEASRVVEETYSEAREALNEKEQAEAEKLREDPQALARFLVRAVRRRARGG